jgi:hypothetical protein
MNLSDYFEKTEGLGILATAGSDGKVDLAIYARPRVIDQNTVAFITSDRLTHKNLQSNPNAAYMFVEKGPGYSGKRLYLTKIREQTAPKLIESIRRKKRKANTADRSKKFLVYFRVDNIRPLASDKH